MAGRWLSGTARGEHSALVGKSAARRSTTTHALLCVVEGMAEDGEFSGFKVFLCSVPQATPTRRRR
jgi:hypothetical protein